MDGNGSSNRGDEMQAQTPPAAPTLCRTGCGFYAHSSFDGMCSKCYKDVVRRQDDPIVQSSSSLLPSSAASTASVSSSAASHSTCSSPVDDLAFPDISTRLPTVAVDAAKMSPTPDVDSQCGGIEGATAAISLDDAAKLISPKEKSKKKKRCHKCQKRVGLTGFDCRCGGHYCGLHRYSDVHGCTFDYRQLAQAEIRRHNPVVAAEKVKKI